MSADATNTTTHAASLADFTNPDLIVPRLHGMDAASVIRELGAVFPPALFSAGGPPFFEAALDREYLCSTATEPGWALPHVVVKGLAQPRFAFGRTVTPIHWVDDKLHRVQMIFLLAVPESEIKVYMNVICALGRLSREPQLVERLLTADSSVKIHDVLGRVPLQVG